MSAHDDYVAKGYCDAIYVDDEAGEYWCRLADDHRDPETNEPDKHVAPWRYEFPKQETMVRWHDGPTDVDWLEWQPDATPTVSWPW